VSCFQRSCSPSLTRFDIHLVFVSFFVGVLTSAPSSPGSHVFFDRLRDNDFPFPGASFFVFTCLFRQGLPPSLFFSGFGRRMIPRSLLMLVFFPHTREVRFALEPPERSFFPGTPRTSSPLRVPDFPLSFCFFQPRRCRVFSFFTSCPSLKSLTARQAPVFFLPPGPFVSAN